jgi:tetratricopeptide (TPR) repeat protein
VRSFFRTACFQGLLPVFLACCPMFAACAKSLPAQAISVTDSLRQEADLFFARQEYGRAAKLYQRIIAADSLDSGATTLMGSCLMRSGRPRQAVALFSRAIDLDPELKLGYLGLVYSYYQLARLDSCRIWAGKCRSVLAGPQQDEWDKMLRENFPLIYRTEEN